MRLTVVLALVLATIEVRAETTCFDSLGLIQPDTLEPASSDDSEAVASLTDEYFRILKSDSPNDALDFVENGGRGGDLASQHLIDGLAVPDAQVYFRRAYSTSVMRGEAGEYVVAEYGLLNEEFHALHFVVWKISAGAWNLANHLWVRRCAPDSKPIHLQPNQSLQQTLDPAGSSADAEAPSASSAAEHRR